MKLVVLVFVINVIPFSFMSAQSTITTSHNTLGLSLGYAKAFTHGFSLNNPVNKTGYTAEISYSRDLTGLLGVGLFVGRSVTKDIANPDLEIKEEELIHYAHIRLLLKVLDLEKHSLSFGAGTGWIKTQRALGYLVNNLGEISRGIQQSNGSGSGVSVHLSYSYQLSNSWSVGVNSVLLGHNEGAWSIGLSSGYHF